MNVFEIEILQFINSNLSNRILDAVFVTMSRLGDKGALWIICALILCIFPKTRKAGICASISLILCLFVGNLILKPIFDRMRPYEFDTSLKIIIPLLKDASFPSGHTMAFFAFAHSVGLCYKKYRVILFVFAALMGLSRIYLCVHFPTDVLFGVIFGICFAILSHKIYTLFPRRGGTQ